MQLEFHSLALQDGFTLHAAPTDKFKTTSFRLVLRQPLQADTYSRTAVVPFVLRRGTRSYPTSRDIARHMEQLYGAQFSADVSKLGETQNVELVMQVAHEKFLPEPVGLTEAAVDFLAEALTRPALEEGVFKGEFVTQEAEMLRRTIERLINNSPQYAVHRLREEMCKDEPFGLHRYGDKDELTRIQAVPLYEHYLHVLQSSPADLFVVGPVDPEALAAMVRERLQLPRGDVMDVAPVAEGAGGHDGAGSRRASRDDVPVVVEEMPVQQGVLTIGCRTNVRYTDEDYPALLVYNGILGAYPHSKLFINVREKASLAYFASSQAEATKGVLIIAAGIAVDKFDAALDIIRAQMDAVAAGDISDEELTQTKKGLVNGLLSGRDSPGRVIGSRYTGIVNGRVRPLQETIAAVQAVTKADVQRVAEGLFEDTVYFLRSPKTD